MLLSTFLRGLLIAFFFITGFYHFLSPQPFVQIVPPYLPYPLALVYVSGALEILGALGLIFPRTRPWAGYGLIALLFAVFPANIYMLTNHPYVGGHQVPLGVLWLRLPLQFLLIAWVWWSAELSRFTKARRKI